MICAHLLGGPLDGTIAGRGGLEPELVAPVGTRSLIRGGPLEADSMAVYVLDRDLDADHGEWCYVYTYADLDAGPLR